MTSISEMRNGPENLRSLLSYCEETGVLTWEERPESMFGSFRAMRVWNGKYAGKPAMAHKCPKGYLRGCIGQDRFLAHRVIWCMVYGQWPNSLIDHINGNPSDNRLSNLREATPKQNMRNSFKKSKCTSQYLGVSWHKRTSTWRATIWVKGRHTHLGHFQNEKAAALAYDAAAVKHFREFANPNFPSGTARGV